MNTADGMVVGLGAVGSPDSERILVASARSGHGFKHSAAVGEAMAELALEGYSTLELAPFRLTQRPA